MSFATKLRELVDKATPRPWIPENPHVIKPSTTLVYLHFGKQIGDHLYEDTLSLASERGSADAEYISYLANRAPAILALVEAAEKTCKLEALDENDYLMQALSALNKECEHE